MKNIKKQFQAIVNSLKVGEYASINNTCIERRESGYVVSNNGWGEAVDTPAQAVKVAVADWKSDNG